MIKILVTNEDLDCEIDLKKNDKKEYSILRSRVKNVSYRLLSIIRVLNDMREEGYKDTFLHRGVRKTSMEIMMDKGSPTYNIWYNEFYVKIRDELYEIIKNVSYGQTVYRWFVKKDDRIKYKRIIDDLDGYINKEYIKVLRKSLKEKNERF